jgi:hypothetical protein
LNDVKSTVRATRNFLGNDARKSYAEVNSMFMNDQPNPTINQTPSKRFSTIVPVSPRAKSIKGMKTLMSSKSIAGACPECGRSGFGANGVPDQKTDPKKLKLSNFDSILDSSAISALFFSAEMTSHLKKNRGNPEVIENVLCTSDHYAFLKKMTHSEEALQDYIMSMTHPHLSQLYDAICSVSQDLSAVLKVGLRVKQMFDYAPDITNAHSINEAMVRVVSHVTDSLECERCIIYQVDVFAGELFSQAGTDLTTQIRIPMDKGVAGWVALNKGILNIREAYADKRFSEKSDKQSGLQTKNILAIPIFNRMGEVDGIIEAINKKPDPVSGKTRFFSQDDEGLLNMLGKVSSVMFNNSTMHNEQMFQYNNLQSILKAGIY